jgi:glycosyltransferase involved in cell wall biosynthesis
MHVLIGAIPKVIKNHKNVHFIIVGEGDQRLELETLTKKLKVEDCLTMPGTIQRDELRSYYNLCDIYVSTSVRDKEGNLDDQSIALVEVMACGGKPTIATDLGGNRLVVKDGFNGYVFPMGDSKKLSEKISNLIKDKKLRDRFSKTAFKMAVEDFSVIGVAKSYTELFKGLNNNKK